MKRLFSAKTFVAASVALGAVVAASAAHARSDVVLSIGLNVPHAYVQPAPVYVQPQPVYVQPRHGYVQPQTIYYGRDRDDDRRYGRGGPNGDWDRDGVANRFDRDSRWFDPRAAYRHGGGRRDADRDGVPNRFDHAPNNPYRY
jgi:hypothetical protein